MVCGAQLPIVLSVQTLEASMVLMAQFMDRFFVGGAQTPHFTSILAPYDRDGQRSHYRDKCCENEAHHGTPNREVSSASCCRRARLWSMACNRRPTKTDQLRPTEVIDTPN